MLIKTHLLNYVISIENMLEKMLKIFLGFLCEYLVSILFYHLEFYTNFVDMSEAPL